MRRLIMTLTLVLICSFILNLPLIRAGEAGSVLVLAVGKEEPKMEVVLHADKIVVYQQDKGHAMLQEIPYSIPAYAELVVSELVSFEDMNFDGYMDLKIASSVGQANRYNDCWLWDKARRQFVLHEELSRLASTVFNSNTQAVHSYTHISAADSQEATYIWENGKLSPVKRIERTYSHADNKLTEREYRSDEQGNLRLVREQEVPMEEVMINF